MGLYTVHLYFFVTVSGTVISTSCRE